MNRSQWILMTTFTASFYGVGNIWMTQFGWRLWPFVAPGSIFIEASPNFAKLPGEIKVDRLHGG